MFLPFLVRGTPYNGQHMRFLRAVCGRCAALCGKTEGRTPTRDAASRAVASLPPQSAATACALRESGPPARFPGFGAPNVSQNHAPCTVSKRVGFANTQKRPNPDAGCGLPGCSPLLPLQSAATACALRESGPPARFLGFGAPNVSQNHAPCTVSKRVGFAKRKKGRTPMRDAASGLSFRRWRCFGCGSCGRRCRRGRPAPRACRTRRCARPG